MYRHLHIRHFISIISFVIIIWCLLFANVFASAQQQMIYTIQKKGFAEIPFEYINGFIVVDVVFQKILPLKFIFDTGAENSVLFNRNITAAFQIPCNKKVKLVGSNLNQEIIADICTGIYLQAGNSPLKLTSMITLEDDFLYIDDYIGIPIDGILGASFFADQIVHIDYKKQRITLIVPDVFKSSKFNKYQKLDLDIIDKKIYLNCETYFTPDTGLQAKMLLDTGAGISAIFHYKADTTDGQHEKWVRGVLGKGLSGDIDGYIGRIHTFSLGSFNFDQMISSFQWIDDAVLSNQKIIRNGIIGNHILERFDIVIDYPGKKLYLKPLKHYNRPFEYDKSGLTVYTYGDRLDQYFIKHVLDYSPAKEAGLMENDIILSINGWSYKWYSLKKIINKLSGKAGKKISLKIQRGQSILKKEIILRDLY